MKFRLQQVLDHRKKREDSLRERLAAAMRARRNAEAELAALSDQERRHREYLSGLLAGGRVDAATVQRTSLLLEGCARAVLAQQQSVARCAGFESEERARLTTAVVERKALDRLRERHEEHQRAEQNRREALMLEEISAARVTRDRASRVATPNG